MSNPNVRERTPLIPVTLVTGFLGAGKTTLLGHVLGTETGLRFAIIENEFGDVGVDGSLVNAPRDTVFELNDGCVCCSVREDLLQVFNEIIASRGAFDHVIIETTGLAEPAPVMRLFEHPAIREAVTLNGVVTVVDARHFEQSLDDVTACAEQIAYADLIIVNKVDGLLSHEVESSEARIREINPLATTLRAEHAQVDVQRILRLGERRTVTHVPAEGMSITDSHHHDETIVSVVVETQGVVDIEILDLWLGQLARSRHPLLLRMKGILAVADSDRSFVFNAVRSVIDVRPGRLWGSESRYSRIVFIGKGLDKATLEAGFDACLPTEPPNPDG